MDDPTSESSDSSPSSTPNSPQHPETSVPTSQSIKKLLRVMTKNTKRDGSGLADPHLLEKIDNLFACNVGEYVDLPQLVVIGDQSSGKSSVLEGLTNLPFPRDSGLCTRFATSISFRRDPVKKINVSIKPGPNASEEHIATVKAFSKSDLEDLDKDSFAQIMREVQVAMGVSGVGESIEQATTFTEDVLRLEVCGPTQDHLTIIDVPGLFRKTLKGVTTQADREMVKNMVVGYMNNPRSLMLAVVPASIDIATQEILDMAADVDPQGIRTLGVLTKPDLVDKGAHQPVLELLAGKAHQLALGWHIVRNPSQQELNDPNPADRHTLEKEYFKRDSAWSTVDKDKLGIAQLRTQLQTILASHIRREFPKVKSEITKKLATCKRDLEALGADRETTAEQNRYLLQISMEYQKLATQAVEANYGGLNLFDEHPSLKLATRVISRNEKFSNAVRLLGHTWSFDKSHTDDQDEDDASIDPKLETYNVRRVEGDVDLENMLLTQMAIDAPKTGEPDALSWVKKEYDDSRGFELGTFDASLLAVTMRKQSTKWNALAEGYIADVATLVHRFIKEVLDLICPDDRIREGILSVLNDQLMERYQKALGQVEYFLEVERANVPITQNHYFNDNLEKCRLNRVRSEAAKHAIYVSQQGKDMVSLDNITKTSNMSNAKHAIRDIHDILKSYYKVARKRFVDDILIGASYHLVTGPNTPLKLFTPAFVVTMSEEQLEDIAGEDIMLKKKKAALKKEIADLEKGRKFLV